MADVKTECRKLVKDALNKLIENKNLEVEKILENDILTETPPDASMGDIGIPLFPFAKKFRMGPPVIASELVKILAEDEFSQVAKKIGEFKATGPYLNVKLDKASESSAILSRIFSQGNDYGKVNVNGEKPMAGQRVMIEFSSPNTNKPLHLGHLRNDALGESVSRILDFQGAEVYKVNIINNRGVHICKSMLAYQKFHQEKGDTPESLGLKSDRFVGDCYVEFNNYAKENPNAEQEAQNMLVEREKGNPENQHGERKHRLCSRRLRRCRNSTDDQSTCSARCWRKSFRTDKHNTDT